MGIGTLVCFIGECNAGMGRHAYYLKPENQSEIAHWQFYHSIVVMLGISFVKLSIGCVLLRFVSSKAYKRTIWGMIGMSAAHRTRLHPLIAPVFLVLFTIACAGTLILSCVPPSATWNFEQKKTATCFSINTFTGIGLFNSSVNALTDLVFVALPIPIILKLQVNRKTKISLIVILGLGVFACAASLVKISYQVNVLRDPDGTRYNLFNVWNAIELYAGIIAACLPTLRPLFKQLLDSTRGWSAWSGARGNSKTPARYGGHSKVTSGNRVSILTRQSRRFRKVEDDDLEELTEFDMIGPDGRVTPGRLRAGMDKEIEARVRIEAFTRRDDNSEDTIMEIPPGAIVKTTDFSVH